MDSPSERDALPNGTSQRPSSDPVPDDGSGELRGALVAGLIGAVVATAGYVIYNRLEDEHREALRKSVTKFVEERVAEVRSQLKF
ncbi:MAG: hypothetical protein JO293_08800 [Candidatus Eremiobacteraeota bacterium]|nr:hypothetical protein [Candidatus Eremiobacteraeota bacterium]MBV8223443.1 hypothetical protein [Candidatus Eremiobacteraeota bacterium]